MVALPLVATTDAGSMGPGGDEVITVVACNGVAISVAAGVAISVAVGVSTALAGVSEVLALMATDVANSDTAGGASTVVLAAEGAGTVVSTDGDLRALTFFRRGALCNAGAVGPSVSDELVSTISLDKPRGIWLGHNWIIEGSLTT